jgi:pimeloyl-ACP methyl ester carboxylesterase
MVGGLALCGALLGLTGTSSAEPHQDQHGDETFGGAPFRPLEREQLCPWHLRVDGDWIPYCRNRRLGVSTTSIERVVLVLHGKHRNARDYYEAALRIATERGVLDRTMILAPQFLTEEDVRHGQLPRRLAYWSRPGWKYGHRALNGQHTSSFEIIDRVLKRLVEQNKGLREIVIAGHSAGAQFAQRHATAHKPDATDSGALVRYVLTNPGTYMFLEKDRPAPTDACQDTYNDYMYGYEDNPVEYFSGLSVDSLLSRFSENRIDLFLGDRDTDPLDTDRSCEARAQGAHRFARGLAFHRSILKQIARMPDPPKRGRISLTVARDVGHEFAKMWDTRCGRSLLFGDGSCSTPGLLPAAKSGR